MDEPVEEFEPLFDYRRVQPLNVVFLDDDSLDSPLADCRKKPKIKNSAVDKKDKNKDVEVVQIVNDKAEKTDKEDEDWLPPPRKITDTTKFSEDSIMKELRLKKQELQLLAQPAKDVLREVEESVKRELAAAESNKRDFGSLLESAAAEGGKEQLARPSHDRAKIIISIQNKDEAKQFRIYMDDKFEKLFKLYADKLKLDQQKLVFSFDGDKISPAATPGGLGMEDNDIIEVHLKKH
ncbi:hypothetical protein M9H77_08328 [Catharanthus roseus]|uniref:Uncharacterized protein n=1 Tax=Catharanthus roseus TaxID=4058 RepID=A0ACC0BXG7_CATRO|nr:hypothetical protein M9H77_08328 [Catharanthus roseus]